MTSKYYLSSVVSTGQDDMAGGGQVVAIYLLNTSDIDFHARSYFVMYINICGITGCSVVEYTPYCNIGYTVVSVVSLYFYTDRSTSGH